MAGTVHTEAYKAFRAILVQARQDAGLSQAQLAARLGKPPSFVGKYELGERRLDVIEALVVCKALEVNGQDVLAELASTAPERLG